MKWSILYSHAELAIYIYMYILGQLVSPKILICSKVKEYLFTLNLFFLRNTVLATATD